MIKILFLTANPTDSIFKVKREHFEHFGSVLCQTAADFDKGYARPEELEAVWQRAIAPGLKYLIKYPKKMRRR